MGRFPDERLDPQSYPPPGLDLPVLYNDIDPNGHLNNVAYGRFFEHVRVLRHDRMNLHRLFELPDPYVLLVAQITIDYLAESGIGEPIHLRCRTAHVGTSSLVEEAAAWQFGSCIALATTTVVLRRGDVAAPWPPEVVTVLDTFREGGVPADLDSLPHYRGPGARRNDRSP
ncbi:MAG: acyl-CoA thioesterase [Tetrasphaera sp.]